MALAQSPLDQWLAPLLQAWPWAALPRPPAELPQPAYAHPALLQPAALPPAPAQRQALPRAQAAQLRSQALLHRTRLLPLLLRAPPLAAPQPWPPRRLHELRWPPAPRQPALPPPCRGRAPCHDLPPPCRQQLALLRQPVPAAAPPGLLPPVRHPPRRRGRPSSRVSAAWHACRQLLPAGLLPGLPPPQAPLPPPSCRPFCRGCACCPCQTCLTCRHHRCRTAAALPQVQVVPHLARQPAWPSRTHPA